MANIKQTLEMIDVCFRHNAIPALVSGAGKGKTMLFEEIANKHGWGFLCLQMSQLEPPDFVGLPHFPDNLYVECDGEVGRVFSADTGSNKAVVVFGLKIKTVDLDKVKVKSYEAVTKHIRPDFFPPMNAMTKGIILLDEINRARPDTRAAVFDFILYKRIIKYILPSGWKIGTAMNPAMDGYQVEELDKALMDRLTFIKFSPTPSDWIRFEQTLCKPEDDSVLDFIRDNPKVLDGEKADFSINQYATRKSFSMVRRVELDKEVPEKIKLELYSGMVGKTATASYFKWKYTQGKEKIQWSKFEQDPNAGIVILKEFVKEKNLQAVKINLNSIFKGFRDLEMTDKHIDIVCRLIKEVKVPDLMLKEMRDLRVYLKENQVDTNLDKLRSHERLKEVLRRMV